MNSSKPDVRFLITVAHYDRYAREIIFFVPKVRPSEWSLRVFLPLIVKAMKVSLKLSHQRLSSHSPTWLYSFIHLHKLFENSNRWYVLNSTYILKNSFLNIQVLQFRWNCKITQRLIITKKYHFLKCIFANIFKYRIYWNYSPGYNKNFDVWDTSEISEKRCKVKLFEFFQNTVDESYHQKNDWKYMSSDKNL